jgi:5-methylcytosine-specific restriction endonuclease McrA
MISVERKAKAAARKRVYYAANREKKKALSRAYCTENPEKVAAYQRAYRATNREKISAQKRTYHKANREMRAVVTRAWRETNSEKVRLYSRRGAAKRRALEHGAFVETVERSIVFARDKGLCGICSLPVDPTDWHLDHIKPLSGGGEHSYANVQVSHTRCNKVKGTT